MKSSHDSLMTTHKVLMRLKSDPCHKFIEILPVLFGQGSILNQEPILHVDNGLSSLLSNCLTCYYKEVCYSSYYKEVCYSSQFFFIDQAISEFVPILFLLLNVHTLISNQGTLLQMISQGVGTSINLISNCGGFREGVNSR